MTKRRAVIVGASGFVGGHLSRAVTAAYDFDLVDLVDPLTGGGVDLRHVDAVQRAIADARPDTVFHLAGVSAPRQANMQPLLAWQTNLMGTVHLAYAIRDHAPTAHLIWAGSAEAYGDAFNRSPTPIDETAALKPLSSYGATKAAADIFLRQMAIDGLRTTIVRPFNHTGPGQTDAFVVPAFAKQIALIEKGLQEPILHVGNLDSSRDFLDVEDVTSAYMSIALSNTIVQGNAYNISTGTPIQIGAILEMLRTTAATRFEVRVDDQRYVKSNTPVASGNPAKAFSDFGWKATTPIEHTLANVLDYWRVAAVPASD